MVELKIGETFEFIIEWMTQNLGFIFDTINVIITSIVTAMTDLFLLVHPLIMIVIFAVLAFLVARQCCQLKGENEFKIQKNCYK